MNDQSVGTLKSIRLRFAGSGFSRVLDYDERSPAYELFVTNWNDND